MSYHRNMSSTVYSQVKLFLKDFVSILESTLGQNLIGAYLYGSFATADFDEALSDIDLLMVLREEVDDGLLKQLESMQDKIKSEHEPCGARIDVAYLSKEALRTFKEKPSKVIVSNDTGGLDIVDAPEYYLIDWYKVREHAITLYGPEAETLVPPITTEMFTETIYKYMLTWPKRATEVDKRTQQAYAVLTMCRSYYAYSHGRHTSKKAGARWVIAKYPEWSGLIEKALTWNRDEKNNNIEDRQNQLQTQEFIKFILCEVNNKA
jgi:predicted nucleotidyltransferase